MTEIFEIKNRFSGRTQIRAEIECATDALPSTKLGLAVKWAVKAKADLRGADLRWADPYGAMFDGADFTRADLRGADLRWATGIRGFISFGPVGAERRDGLVTFEDGCEKIQLGCFTGDLDETVTAIRKKYGDGSTYEALVRAAVSEMMSHVKKGE